MDRGGFKNINLVITSPLFVQYYVILCDINPLNEVYFNIMGLID